MMRTAIPLAVRCIRLRARERPAFRAFVEWRLVGFVVGNRRGRADR
jgi:hypothetical protein